MTVEETIKLLALVKLAYPEAYKGVDGDTVNATISMWHKHFKSAPYTIMEMALERFVKRSKFAPKVADIYEELRRLNGWAFSNLFLMTEGQSKDAVLYILENTKQFDERYCGDICADAAQNILCGSGRPLIEG